MNLKEVLESEVRDVLEERLSDRDLETKFQKCCSNKESFIMSVADYLEGDGHFWNWLAEHIDINIDAVIKETKE